MLPERSLRHCVSASDLNNSYISYDDQDNQIAVIDHLQKLHDEVITKYQRLNKNLSEEYAILERKCAEQQLATRQLESAEVSRKRGATRRAQARDQEIARLREKLQREKDRNTALEDYAAQANKFIHNTQDDIQSLKFQLERVRRQREEKESRVNRLVVSNTALREKIATIAREIEERKHKQDAVERKLEQNAMQERERAGLAFIQRDLERARRKAGVPFSQVAQAYDDKAMCALTTSTDLDTGKKTKQAVAQGQRKSDMATFTLEFRLLSVTEENRSLKQQNEQLRGVNQVVIAEIHRLKQELRGLCGRTGLEFDKIIRAAT